MSTATKPLTGWQREERLVAEAGERFRRDTAGHQMTVMLDNGLHRHLRFSHPAQSAYWFEIVTWPGSLAVRGDMGGGYVFHRTTDMFEFFRRNGNQAGINPGYWAEKLEHPIRATVRAFSEDALRARIDDEVAEYEERFPEMSAEHAKAKAAYDAAGWRDRYPMAVNGPREPANCRTPDEIRELVDGFDADGYLAHEDGAWDLLRELERAGIVEDTYEWELHTWDFAYLWICHAIVWGIAQYDAVREAAGALAVAS